MYWLLLGVDDQAYVGACAQTRATPTYADAWLKRGLIELRCKRHHDANVSLAHAVRLDRDLMEGWALLSTLWAEEDKPLAALMTAQRVLNARPDLAPIVAQTAVALAEREAIIEALDTLEAVTATGYITPQLARLHARLLGVCGFSAQANEALRAVWQERSEQDR